MTERGFLSIKERSDELGDAASVVALLVGGTLVRSELVSDGPACTLRRVELADGRVLGVKQYAHGRDYAIEGAALREIAEQAPVPEIVCTLDRVIAYRWIEGLTLNECWELDASALAALAVPLGRLLGTLARMRREPASMNLAPALAQLEHGPARQRLGSELADALRRVVAAHRFDDPTCFSHGDLDGHNVIVAPTMDRIAGVVDWAAATIGSQLADVGSLLRDASRYDTGFRAAFERAHGSLPADWWPRARLLDAMRLVASPVGHREHLRDAAELRALITDVVASY